MKLGTALLAGSDLDHEQFLTVEDMRTFAGEAWGALGVAMADRWCKFNASYFDGVLRPIPIVITSTLPFGRKVGQCSHGNGRTITLNIPKDHGALVADNNTPLHEMVHQFLQERGEDPKHAGEPWRREIMRLTRVVTGCDIWAGASKTVRRGKSVLRMNVVHPETGEASFKQMQIARWPHDHLGIDLGRLGQPV